MASGYIGKISAIVTANTSDLSRKLSQSSKEANAFAVSLRSSIDRAGTNAQKSLEKIFTPLQQLERQLKAASFRSLDLKLPVDKVRAFVSAAEAINKPLERSAGGFAKLSTEVQAALTPALNAAQDAALSVNRQIENTGGVAQKSFDAATAAARRFGAASRAALQAQEIAGRGLTGSELQFRSPAAFAALTRTADLTKRVGGLPSSALEDGNLRGKVEQLTRISSRIQAEFFKLDNLKLTGAPAAQIDAANEKLQRLANVARQGQDELEALANRFDPLAQKNAGEAEIKALIDREKKALQVEKEILDAKDQQIKKAKEIEAAEIQALINREKKGLQVEAALQAAKDQQIKKAKEIEAAEIQALINREKKGLEVEAALQAAKDQQIKKAKEIEAAEIQALINREKKGLEVEAALQAAKDQQIKKAKEIEAAEIQALINREKKGLEVEAALQAAKDQEIKKAKEIEAAEIQALINREKKGLQVEAAIQAARQKTIQGQRENAGASFRSGFGGPGSAGINFGFEQQALSAYTAQLQVLQRAIGSASAEARGPAVAAFSRLRDVIANAMERGELETRETRNEIRRLTQEAVAASASVAGISARALGRSVNRAGDVSRRGFDNISLALNQAAFAVDDFFSSTGGLEFKIRAVQNNLTQLGFILGGTAGLFASLGFVIAGQATIALINFINEGRKTEDMVKALNDSLMRQKEVAKEVGTAFNDIGKELRSDVFSDAANDADRLTASLEKIADAFKRLREERIAQPSVTAQEAQATVNSLERRLKTEEDPGVRVLLQRQLLEAQTKRTEVNATLSSPITVADGIARFREAITPLEESRGSGTQQRLTREQIGRNIDSVISNADIRDFAGLRAAVEARFDETAAIVNTGEGAYRAFRGANSDVAADEIGNLQSLLVSMQGFQKAGEALTNAARVSDNIGNSLADARDRIEDFGEGVESSQEFSDAVDEQARILSEAVSTISESFSKLDKLEITPEEFLESLNAAAAKVDAEAAKRAQLIARIEDVFNEEEVLRREADEERQKSAERGADLVRSPGERLAKETLESILDIQNAFGLRTPENLARAQPSVESFLGEQRRSIAPALFTLQDTIANAVLQGPSRAALNAADVTTTQGTAELNRLLRGDDPARDQNLLELQKQTAELEKLNQTLGAAGVAD
jgi:hypothetical protein